MNDRIEQDEEVIVYTIYQEFRIHQLLLTSPDKLTDINLLPVILTLMKVEKNTDGSFTINYKIISKVHRYYIRKAIKLSDDRTRKVATECYLFLKLITHMDKLWKSMLGLNWKFKPKKMYK